MKTEAAVLLSQLQATHATLMAQRAACEAALLQLGTSILALKAAIDGEDGASDGASSPACPTCGRTNVLPAGADGAGHAIYVCECGNNFTVETGATSPS